MLRVSYAGYLGLSPAILAQLTLEMCITARNCEKFTKDPYFGDSRSFNVIDIDMPKTLSQMLVTISSMSVPICNRFHAG